MTTGLSAVVREAGGPFLLEEVQLADPRPDEVLVEIVASGLCHTDLLVRDSRPESLPAVLGHEGAGVVREVGSDIRGVAPGDKVVLSFPSCGVCLRCRTGRSAYCDSIAALKFGCRRPDGSVATTDAEGRRVGDHFFGQSSFGTIAVVNGRSVVPMPEDVDLRIAGPLACGVQTGAGTVLDVLRVPPGSSIAVFGAGSVGPLRGSWRRGWPGRRRSSRSTGAPPAWPWPPSSGPPTWSPHRRSIRCRRSGRRPAARGVEFAFETTGVPEVLTQAVRSLDSLGTCAYVGTAAPGELGGSRCWKP